MNLYADFVPLQSSAVASISEEASAARNAKLVSFSGGDNATLQADGGFIILKASNVLKSR